jgi:hypothetical protein
MIPAVPAPDGAVRTPIELKLKPKWRFDASRREFVSASGESFVPRDSLPSRTKIVYKVTRLAEADEAQLSKYEKDLRRYMQVILPPGVSPADYVDVVRAWPSVAEAYAGPQFSLPSSM